MSLLNRIKKAKAKAEKLSEKSKKAKSKGKDKRSANLEKRSEKKSGKADKLTKKLGAKVAVSALKGMTFGTGETLKKKYNAPDLSKYNPLPLATPKSGPKDTSYKKGTTPYHGKVDKNGNPPTTLKKNKK